MEKPHQDKELNLLRFLAAGLSLVYAYRCIRKEKTLAVAVDNKDAMRGRFNRVEGLFAGVMDDVSLPPPLKASLTYAGREIISNIGKDYVYGEEDEEEM